MSKHAKSTEAPTTNPVLPKCVEGFNFISTAKNKASTKYDTTHKYAKNALLPKKGAHHILMIPYVNTQYARNLDW
jgi:hypothetical protein